jgi:two-component system, LytTR family, sensor kinase
MIKNTKDNRSIDNALVRIICILFIGIIMPMIFYTNSGLSELIKWVIISTSLTFIAWETSRRVVSFIWNRFSWETNPVLHLLLITLFLTLLTILLCSLVYYINYLFDDVTDNYWIKMRGVHLSIILLTFFITSVYEGTFLFYKWKKTLVLTALLEKENIQSQFETLKNQVNPHFLFNSLNALASIIPEDPEKAVEYINKFSSIYRYVLDVKDLTSVELKDEMDFVNSYIYLQKIRYGENLQVITTIDEKKLNSHIMPLSLQVLVENAIKHNEISDIYPLKIELIINEDYLIVKNNLRRISCNLDSPKIGLKNLSERYRLVSDSKPYFHQNENEFIAGIPLLREV